MVDSTIRVKGITKQKLEKLDFVGKRHSFNDIIEELIENYSKRKNN